MKSIKHLFFCEDIDSLSLSKPESHHATKVLRLQQGDPLCIMDGKGRIVDAIITEISKNNTQFEVTHSVLHKPFEKNLHIAIAPTKSNERTEFFLEKCTEIGISSFTPIITKNSERTKINKERWQKIILSASKQSQVPYFPILNEIESFNDFIQKNREGDLFIAHCEDQPEKYALKNAITNAKEICILIGPEGDFTTEEITFALEHNYKPISLGNTRLRTETAGIVACHTVNLFI